MGKDRSPPCRRRRPLSNSRPLAECTVMNVTESRPRRRQGCRGRCAGASHSMKSDNVGTWKPRGIEPSSAMTGPSSRASRASREAASWHLRERLAVGERARACVDVIAHDAEELSYVLRPTATRLFVYAAPRAPRRGRVFSTIMSTTDDTGRPGRCDASSMSATN